jgi:hypothetical protein
MTRGTCINGGGKNWIISMKIFRRGLMAIAVICWMSHAIHALSQSAKPDPGANVNKTACDQIHAEWTLLEPSAVKEIVKRSAIAFPEEAIIKDIKSARVQLCLLVDKDGNAANAGVRCGNEPFASAALVAVKTWKFKPSSEHSTSLTFQWKDGKGGLIWDFRDYPISESEALSILKLVPKVKRAFQLRKDMQLVVDWYPEERDGIFYTFHLYYDLLNSEGLGMMWTGGWFAINSYTGEIWDMLEENKVNTQAIKKKREEILARTGGLKQINRKYLGLSFYALDELMKNSCAERPPKDIPQPRDSR